MTQEQLAEAASVPLRTLKAWEKEKQPDSLDTAVRLAGALHVTLDQLAGLGKPREPPRRAVEVIVDGVRYVPDTPHHAVAASAAGSDLGDRPSDAPGSVGPVVGGALPQPPGRTRRARRKSSSPSLGE